MYICAVNKINMLIQTERNTDFTEVKDVTIQVGEVEFIITLNKFEQLVVTKVQYGGGEGSIIIVPQVSNQIIIK